MAAKGGRGATSGPTPRVRNAWGQGEALRTEILEAAGRMLGELGSVDRFTLRGVARLAGIAPASIYAHFADKSDLIAALIDHEYARLADLMRDAGADPADPVSGVRAQLYTFCQFLLANPGHYGIMFRLPCGRSGQRHPARPLLDLLTESLLAAEQAGALLRLPAERVAVVLVVGTHGRLAISHVQADDEAGVLEFVDELLFLVFETG